MADAIRSLTPDVLRAQARDAAEQGIPLAEANHHEPGTPLWFQFGAAYLQHQATEQECEVH